VGVYVDQRRWRLSGHVAIFFLVVSWSASGYLVKLSQTNYAGNFKSPFFISWICQSSVAGASVVGLVFRFLAGHSICFRSSDCIKKAEKRHRTIVPVPLCPVSDVDRGLNQHGDF